MIKKPAFDQFVHVAMKEGKALQQQAREPYRHAIVEFLESEGDILVQKARKDGHDDASIEIHAIWVGPSYDPDDVVRVMRESWPGKLFPKTEQMHWVERDEEVVTLRFMWHSAAQFLSGKITINPS